MKVTVSGDTAVKQQLQQIGRQAPFALATALNATANSVQQAVRASLTAQFTLRRKTFVERTIYRQPGQDFATKSKFQAVVRVHPERDVLAQHEEGGTKGPREGRSIAIPTTNARRNKAEIVSQANRPRALIAKGTAFRRGDVLLKKSGRGKRAKLLTLFVFKRSVRLRPRLGMHETAQRVIPDVWEQHALNAIERAMATAR